MWFGWEPVWQLCRTLGHIITCWSFTHAGRILLSTHLTFSRLWRKLSCLLLSHSGSQLTRVHFPRPYFHALFLLWEYLVTFILPGTSPTLPLNFAILRRKETTYFSSVIRIWRLPLPIAAIIHPLGKRAGELRRLFWHWGRGNLRRSCAKRQREGS